MPSNRIRNISTIVSRLYGGMSTDDYVGTGDVNGEPMSFYDSIDLDVRKQRKYATLSGKGTDVMLTLGTYLSVGNVVSTVYYANNQTFITSSGNVFDNSASLVLTHSTTVDGTFEWNDGTDNYNYVVKSNGSVDRWKIVNNPSTGAATNFTANVFSLSSYPGLYRACSVSVGGFVYLAEKNKVWQIDPATATSQLYLELDRDYAITAMTYIGDRFYIYGGNGSHGKQWLWNGIKLVTGTVATVGQLALINWYDRPIINVANINNVDYAFVGDFGKRALYQVSGYSPQLVAKSKEETTSIIDKKFYFRPYHTNSIETVGQVVYVPGERCIYSYGKDVAGMPDSIVRQWSVPCYQLDGNDSVHMLWYNDRNSTITVGYRHENGNTVIGRWSTMEHDTYNPLGTVLLNPIIGPLYSTEESALKLRVGYDAFDKTAINVYSKVGYQGNYASFYVNTAHASLPAIGDVYGAYTVYAVTSHPSSLATFVVHTTCADVHTDMEKTMVYGGGTLTKTSGTGPSTISYFRSTRGLKLEATITDATKHKQLIDMREPSHQVALAFDLVSFDGNNSPRLWDVIYAYTEIENDI